MNKKMKHDYQCNAAMSLAKRYHLTDGNGIEIKNPRDVAQQIVKNVPGIHFYL